LSNLAVAVVFDHHDADEGRPRADQMVGRLSLSVRKMATQEIRVDGPTGGAGNVAVAGEGRIELGAVISTKVQRCDEKRRLVLISVGRCVVIDHYMDLWHGQPRIRTHARFHGVADFYVFHWAL
jgi:hypothetical protein